ncbi:hypothetical protein BH10BAC5_BH10BAC5_24580 [soil metagenome]
MSKLFNIVTDKLDKVEGQVNEIKLKALPAIENINTVVNSVNKIVNVVEENTRVLTNTVEKIDGAVDDIISFEKNIQTKAGIPIMETINSYSALVYGVKTFFNKLGERRTHREYTGGKSAYYEDPENVYNAHTNSSYQSENMELEDINKELDLVRKKLEEMRKE